MTANGTALDFIDSFLASSPEMLFVAGVDGTLLRWSDSLTQTLGRELEPSSLLAQIAHPDDGHAIEQGWSRLLESTQSKESVQMAFRVQDSQGTYRRFSCALRWSRDRDFVHGSLREPDPRAPSTTELEGLRESAQILEALMKNVSICVWAIDRDGVFTFHDGKGLESAGLTPRQLVGQNIFELYDSTEASTSEIRGALVGTPAHSFTQLNGVQWESWLVPAWKGNEVTSVTGFTLDVSDAKRAEQDLRTKLAIIEQQQRVIRNLSTPILEVWEGVLTLPMVGVVDSVRVSEVMDNLLQEIVEKRARFAIVDLTGVEVVDTKVASHLIDLVSAIRLLGAEGIVTGIRPTVAQTMVALGLDLSSVLTMANLRAGLSFAIRRMSQGRPQTANGPA